MVLLGFQLLVVVHRYADVTLLDRAQQFQGGSLGEGDAGGSGKSGAFVRAGNV